MLIWKCKLNCWPVESVSNILLKGVCRGFVVVVQLLGHVQLCNPMDCSMLGFSVHHYLPEFSQIIVHWLVMLFNHLTFCHSFCFQSFPASVSFPMSQLFTSGGQSNGASAIASVLSVNIQGWFPLWLTGLIFLQPQGLSRVFSSTKIWKHQFFSAQPSLWPRAHICTWVLEKP